MRTGKGDSILLPSNFQPRPLWHGEHTRSVIVDGFGINNKENSQKKRQSNEDEEELPMIPSFLFHLLFLLKV